MAIQDYVTLQVKCENNSSMTTPMTGTSGTIVGTLNYAPAKFNNGTYANAGGCGVTYNRLATFANANRYIIECWIKWRIASTAWATTEWFFADRQFLTFHGVTFGIASTKQLVVYLKDAAGDNAYVSTAISFSADQLDHFLFIIDKNKTFDGTKTWAIYRNEVQVHSGTKNQNATVLNTNCAFINAYPVVGVAESLKNGIMDNIKVYNENAIPLLSDIFANKNNEGFPQPVTTKNYYFNSKILQSKSLSTPIIKNGYFNSEIVKNKDFDTPIL